jgi:tRNA threonylcarbamoyladenosine biosynthesis protein TsaB
MKVLGITSAVDIVGAAISGDVVAECSISSSIVRSEKLITLVDDVLKKTKLKISDIDAISVTIGPGSYSGLRGGLATAKAIVSAMNIPIIAVSTLEAIAYNFIANEGLIAIVSNACRDDYNVALFGSDNGKMKRITNDVTVKLNTIGNVLNSVKGRIILVSDDHVRGKVTSKAIVHADKANSMPWAVNVANIGMRKLNNKETEDYLTVSPKYSHKPNIREHKK